ncbi:hypothetical protein EMIHUDRAFT_232912 [Emiliania huxleyi CCMP1516]|uniref:H(+)-exporting diphosphatase n=2 Tax=Emiliania huxleyi TaxID=2903 RepID=A0A0D3K3R1_EMIH1|nr:hypothetical protein EMIHUDRAFT_232912 [Emiliania huxleyi CCMP1516]EOD30396.1 hypothetical protein EMIHUDRAFT_232912 [Emiliania huxleyi CCMP1516]|eukprot:XP_005782825.1 hypothetical protein EMIHUDRAFT_232912 [Emiliania huxleyi CCMP1516]
MDTVVKAATGVYVKSFMAEFLQARLAASLAASPIVTASPPAQFFTIILAWITGILGIVTLIYGVGAQVVALGAPAAAVVAGGAMASAVNDIASNPIGMPRGSCSPPAGMSPDTLVGTTGSLLGASGDSAATQLQADLQANGVELPTDIGGSMMNTTTRAPHPDGMIMESPGTRAAAALGVREERGT